MRSVVVTGTSSGIGWSTAKLLLERGFRVFGSVLSQSEADHLQQEFSSGFTPLVFDVTDEKAVHDAADQVRVALKGERLAGLVNNAGVAISGPALDVPIVDVRRLIDVNVIGPLIVTQAFGPLLGVDASLTGSPGRIVMMSSITGKIGYPLMSAYCASKHAIEGLAESLRREFILFGIDVIIVGPGPAKTPIWDRIDEDATAYVKSPLSFPLFKVREYGKEFVEEAGLSADRIAALVCHALITRRPRVRYALNPNPLTILMATLLPKRIVDRVVAKRFDLLPPNR